MNFFDNLELSPVVHFASNLKKIKDVSISWSVAKKLQENKDLVDIENLLAQSFHKMGFGFASEEDKSSLVDLESRKRKILLEREQEARMKSKALWLLCGDDNTPFFHKYANNRKIINSIWKITDGDGNMVEGFEAIAEVGVKHFESLFQEESNLHLRELL